jgi:hypothetical protein
MNTKSECWKAEGENMKRLQNELDILREKNKKKQFIIDICNQWIEKGYGDECFWEPWPECPTEEVLTPKILIEVLNS